MIYWIFAGIAVVGIVIGIVLIRYGHRTGYEYARKTLLAKGEFTACVVLDEYKL